MNKIYLVIVLAFCMDHVTLNSQDLIDGDHLASTENPAVIEYFYPYKNGIIYFLTSDGCFSSETEILFIENMDKRPHFLKVIIFHLKSILILGPTLHYRFC